MKRITTIGIKERTWKELSALKEIGDSFDDVIHELVVEHKEKNRSSNSYETESSV